MKNQKILILTGALLLAGLVGCKTPSSSSEPSSGSEPSSTPSSETSSEVISSEEEGITVEEAEEIIAKFDTTLTGTVKATYHANYKLTVDSTNQSMLDRQEDVDLVYTVEADFTEGDLYLHVYVGSGEEAQSLVLVYEATDGYYYIENTSAAPIKLQNEQAALSKIYDSLKKFTKTKAGWVDQSTFLYTGELQYEYSQFLLDTTNITPDMLIDNRQFEENENGGLDISTAMYYVGYNTDSGISELSPKEDSVDKAGANVVVSTDSKGRVVSFTETYEEAQLEMQLTTPPPVIHLTGSNTFAAEYGVTLTKKDTIPHEATFGIISYSGVGSQNKGYYDVYTCAYGDWNNMTRLHSGEQAKVGDWVCVKPTAAGSNQVAYVSYGTSTEAVVFENYYCFEILGGTQELSVIFSGGDTLPEEVKVSVEEDTHVTSSTVTWFEMTNPTVQNPTTNNVVSVGKWAGITLNVEAGYAVKSVSVNGKELQNFYGIYCYEVVAGRDVTVEIETIQVADLTITKDANVTKADAVTFTVNGYNVSEMVPAIKVGQNLKANVGEWLGVAVECEDGYEVDSVKVNGADAMFMQNYYCYNVKTADPIEIVITTKSKAPVAQPTVTITKDAHVATAIGYTYTLTNNVASERIPLVDNKAIIGQWLGVQVTCEEGYEIETVTINGKAVNEMFGYYNFNVVDGSAIEVVVTTKAKNASVLAAAVTVTKDANVVSAPLTWFSMSNPTVQNPCEDGYVEVGNYASVKITCAEGYVVDTVKANGVDCTSGFGYYYIEVTSIDALEIVITTKAA